MGIIAVTARFGAFADQLKRVEQGAKKAAGETKKLTGNAKEAYDAISVNDRLLEKIRSTDVLGQLIDQYMALAALAKKNPARDQTGLLRLEQIIRSNIRGGNSINFNLLRSGMTRLKPDEAVLNGGMGGGFIDLMRKMGLLTSR